MDYKTEEFFKQPNEIFYISSRIPSICKEIDCIMGIDEAGRGPVLGPMVYGAAYYPLEMKKDLESEKFQDSKTLSEKERGDMFEKINTGFEIGWNATILSPIVISNSMLRRSKYNLNSLSHDTAIALIQKALDDGVQLKEVYLDTVGPAETYQKKLKDIFPNLKIKVSPKADSIYKIVSVASICAKVIRDHIIHHWSFHEGFVFENYGSGYPGDPKTKQFLKDSFDPVFGFPSFIRFSWSTASKFIEEKGVDMEWEDDKDEEENLGGDQITKFFQKAKPIKMKASSFFEDRNIHQVTSLDSLFD